MHDLKLNTSDIEAQLQKLQQQYDELNKNYDFIVKNHKSAEMLNTYRKKVQDIAEEKAILTESHRLIAINLANEINELSIKLKEYEKKSDSINEQQRQQNKIDSITEEKSKIIYFYILSL
jgi:hypothetical protein